MKKIIQWLMTYPAIIVGLLYTYWLFSIPMEFNTHDEVFNNFKFGLILLFAYLIIYFLANFAGKRKNWIYSVLAISVLLASSIITLELMFWLIYVNTPGLLTLICFSLAMALLIYPIQKATYNLSRGHKVLYAFLLAATAPALYVNLGYFFTYYPEVYKTQIYKDKKYHLVSTIDSDGHSFFYIYRCQKFSFTCDGLYGSWNLSEWPDEIIIDKSKNEVNIIQSSPHPSLMFTDSEAPRYYETYTNAQLTGQLFFLSTKYFDGECDNQYSCDTYVFTLYECDTDYTSCDPLPIQYSTEYEDSLFLDQDETKNEIYLRDNDENLIFIYGEKSQCFVKGCSILE